jgi:multiple RNA-binding domain-containing protein 1
MDSLSGQSKGLAYVTFKRAQDAVSAYESLDKTSFQGRLLHILAAVDRRGASGPEDGNKKHTLKDDRLTERKKNAGKEFNWGMLFMNVSWLVFSLSLICAHGNVQSDAVASSIADRMNIDKADILNDAESSSNPAVKLALAETHVINETKAFLESQGIVLSAFANSRTKRSETIILVKNIPYGTSEQTIRELFEPHGSLSRVIVPPAGTIAVVEFDQSHEAENAFRAVAYRRVGNSIVYLEKGPVGMFSETQTPSSGMPSIQHSIVKLPEQEQEDADESQQPSLAAGSTLFIKNLSFSTTTERLNQVFRNLPSFSFARVQTKPDPKRPGGTLSMGYGFVGFKDVEAAKKAMKSMQGFALDGHALSIKFAGRGRDEAQEQENTNGASKSKTTTKMIVKNVPFEATKKDIRDLFGYSFLCYYDVLIITHPCSSLSSHAHLKSVRLPKKFDSRSRGFAFLDFMSRREAEHAYETLRHTHLLGRHLVLEWAEETEDIEALRDKMRAGLGHGDVPGRKRKLVMEDSQVDEAE